MSSDRKAVNREYKGAQTGHQDQNVTGKPVKTPPEPQDRQRNSSTLDVQVRDITVDAEKWASDRGGLSTAFGKGVTGDKRGTSGPSSPGDIKRPVTPQGTKPADSKSMSR